MDLNKFRVDTSNHDKTVTTKEVMHSVPAGISARLSDCPVQHDSDCTDKTMGVIKHEVSDFSFNGEYREPTASKYELAAPCINLSLI